MFEVGFLELYLGVGTMLILGHEGLPRAGEPKWLGSEVMLHHPALAEPGERVTSHRGSGPPE
jgi:hypothetical protein